MLPVISVFEPSVHGRTGPYRDPSGPYEDPLGPYGYPNGPYGNPTGPYVDLTGLVWSCLISIEGFGTLKPKYRTDGMRYH